MFRALVVVVALLAAVNATDFTAITVTDVSSTVLTNPNFVQVDVDATMAFEGDFDEDTKFVVEVGFVPAFDACSVSGTDLACSFVIPASTSIVPGQTGPPALAAYATVRIAGSHYDGGWFGSNIFNSEDLATKLGVSVPAPTLSSVDLVEDTTRVSETDTAGAVSISVTLETTSFDPILYVYVVGSNSAVSTYLQLESDESYDTPENYWDVPLPSGNTFVRSPETGEPTTSTPTTWTIPVSGIPDYQTAAGNYDITSVSVLTSSGTHTFEIEPITVFVRGDGTGIYYAVGGLIFAGAVGGAYSQRRNKGGKALMKKKAASGAAVARGIKPEPTTEAETAPAYDSLQQASSLLAAKTPEAKAAAEETTEKKSAGGRKSSGSKRRSGSGSKRRSGGSKRSGGSNRSKGSVRFDSEAGATPKE